MKKILFIGDSIMYGFKRVPGYGHFVKESLADTAEVILPFDNCQDVRYTYTFLEELFDIQDVKTADVIHWNNGLWDILHFAGSSVPRTSVDIYLSHIKKLYEKLKELNPDAEIVFATMTRVREDAHTSVSYRKNTEVDEYNLAAVQLLTDYDVKINDLCEASESLDRSHFADDSVHYNEHGAQELAKTVIGFFEKEFLLV